MVRSGGDPTDPTNSNSTNAIWRRHRPGECILSAQAVYGGRSPVNGTLYFQGTHLYSTNRMKSAFPGGRRWPSSDRREGDLERMRAPTSTLLFTLIDTDLTMLATSTSIKTQFTQVGRQSSLRSTRKTVKVMVRRKADGGGAHLPVLLSHTRTTRTLTTTVHDP